MMSCVGSYSTDALIGAHTCAHDPSLLQNRTFLYHVIGNGTGEWAVPVGGMGAVAAAFEQAARDAGAELCVRAEVTGLDRGDRRGALARRGWRRAGRVGPVCSRQCRTEDFVAPARQRAGIG